MKTKLWIQSWRELMTSLLKISEELHLEIGLSGMCQYFPKMIDHDTLKVMGQNRSSSSLDDDGNDR